jgi:hypothetical protein
MYYKAASTVATRDPDFNCLSRRKKPKFSESLRNSTEMCGESECPEDFVERGKKAAEARRRMARDAAQRELLESSKL